MHYMGGSSMTKSKNGSKPLTGVPKPLKEIAEKLIKQAKSNPDLNEAAANAAEAAANYAAKFAAASANAHQQRKYEKEEQHFSKEVNRLRALITKPISNYNIKPNIKPLNNPKYSHRITVLSRSKPNAIGGGRRKTRNKKMKV